MDMLNQCFSPATSKGRDVNRQKHWAHQERNGGAAAAASSSAKETDVTRG